MMTVADPANAYDMHAFELLRPASIDFLFQRSNDLHPAMFVDVGEPPTHLQI